MILFAYGSNMNHQQMRLRCPGSVFLKRAFLEDYKFVYDGVSVRRGGAVANVVYEPGQVVWGGLFEINEHDLIALDRYEGYPDSYDRKILCIEDEVGTMCDAIVYCRDQKEPGVPFAEYRRNILQGARDCGLPLDYVRDNL